MSIDSNAPRVISFGKLHAFTKAAFESVGLSPADAATGADVLVTTDAWGVFTHGTKNLRGYLRLLKAGGLQSRARPEIATQGAAWALIDGHAALGMITSVFAMQTAITKAKQSGIAYVGVRNSSHYGAAGYYTWLAAREGLIGLSMANDIPSVAAPGSRAAITGSNPLSYAVPAGRHGTVALDMSIATVAGGKVYAARQRGESIPGNWLIGADGKPTSDPSGYPETGALQPAAGHKGYGLALLIEMLAGNLTGAGMTKQVGSWLFDDPTKPTNHGAAFIAINVGAMQPLNTFMERAEALVDEIHNAPRADGIERIYVPGEMERERYDRAQAGGIALPSDVVASLRDAAKLSGQDLTRALGISA
jgi:LDH2 family malate/lactate/ureidoglycolate dehydrogenase